MSAKKGQDDINVPQFPSYRISKQDLKYFHPKCGATGKTHTDLNSRVIDAIFHTLSIRIVMLYILRVPQETI